MKEVEQSIHAVSQAMGKFLDLLDERIKHLESSGEDPEALQRFNKGVYALQDTGGIYMTWARHYAKIFAGSEAESEDLNEFLDEGGERFENPFLDR